jgi:aminoglycoside 3-N-acetyltransferase I
VPHPLRFSKGAVFDFELNSINKHYPEAAMTYSYQQLSSPDVPLLKNLLKVFGEAFNDLSTYQDAVPSDQYLQSLLAKPHFIALVAMHDHQVVGGLAAYELEKFERERREIYIYDLAVAEEHRRKGLATNLIKELQRIAKTRDTYVIFVQADPEDEPAICLYESFGKRESPYHFDIPVK